MNKNPTKKMEDKNESLVPQCQKTRKSKSKMKQRSRKT